METLINNGRTELTKETTELLKCIYEKKIYSKRHNHQVSQKYPQKKKFIIQTALNSCLTLPHPASTSTNSIYVSCVQTVILWNLEIICKI